MIFWSDDYAALSQPMTHGRIMHTPLSGTATASEVVAGAGAAAAFTASTYNFWRPNNPGQWIQLELPEARVVDCVSLVARAAGQTILVERDDGDGYSPLISGTPKDNGAVMLLFKPQSVTKIRLTFSGVPQVPVIYIGEALALPVAAYQGVQASGLYRVTTFASNNSQAGNFLGRSIRRTGLSVSTELRHIPETVYIERIEPFSLAARLRPVFYAPRPKGYDQDVVFVRIDQDITPERMGIADRVQFGFSGDGYAF